MIIKVWIQDINNLRFVFPEAELSGNQLILPEIILEKSNMGLDFSNMKQVCNFLKEIKYFSDDRKYNKVMLFKGDELSLCRYLSMLRLKFVQSDADENSYLTDFYSMKHLDRVSKLKQVKDLDQFLINSLHFFKKVLKFDSNTAYKNVLLSIRSRINRDFLRGFQLYNDGYDVFLFQNVLKD